MELEFKKLGKAKGCILKDDVIIYKNKEYSLGTMATLYKKNIENVTYLTMYFRTPNKFFDREVNLNYYNDREPDFSNGEKAYIKLKKYVDIDYIKKFSREAYEYDEKCKNIYKKYFNENYDLNDEKINNFLCNTYSISKKELMELYNKGKVIVDLEMVSQKEKLINQNKIDFDKTSKKIYQMCVKENYDINDDDVSSVMCTTYGVSKEELIKLYNKGKDLINKEEKVEIVKRVSEDRKKELELLIQEKEKINEFGKNKYLNLLNKTLENFKTKSKVSSSMYDSLINASILGGHSSTTDSYFFAGMANGIAGPAAAMMTANRIEKENEEAKVRGEKFVQNARESAAEFGKIEYNLNKMIDKINKMISRIENALIIDDVEKLNKKIDFYNIDYKILESKNINVNVKYNLKEIKILNSDGVLDGCLKINVYDKDKNIISEGYYNTGNLVINENNYIDSNDIGFKTNGNFDVLCMTKNYDSINSNLVDHIEIIPIHLWIIEKSAL